ncbi:MAG: hypothetical protein QXN34_07605 [Archaeoglobaceae archaeon]
MPFKLSDEKSGKCSVCGKISEKLILAKTCCVNKPVTFCSKSCYQKWKAEWLKKQL